MDALDSLEDRLTVALDRAPDGDAVLRVGLGVVILLAGAHKLVAPGPWEEYLAPVFAERWPVPLDATMVAFGISELPFGIALIGGWYTALAAAVVAVSMLGVLVDLGILWLQTGAGADVAIRDFGAFVLATGVAIRAARTG